MAIVLSSAFIAQLKKPNHPVVIFEVELDSGTVKWGTETGGYSDVLPILGANLPSIQNKIDSSGRSVSVGVIKITILGRDNFKNLIKNEYIMNRRVTRKDGFLAAGFLYSEYADTFTGVISDWARKGDQLTITITDDRIKGDIRLPKEKEDKTQYLDYRNTNPIDIITDIWTNQLGVAAGLVDIAQFNSERDLWYSTWIFDRVITAPEKALHLVEEIAHEVDGNVFHDGAKINFRAYAPPPPTREISTWTEDINIILRSLSEEGGYNKTFFNRVVFNFDFDEDKTYQSTVIEIDTVSKSPSEWDLEKTKTINSKWIKSFTYTQPVLFTGAIIYASSFDNGAGSGTITFIFAADNKSTAQWTAPGGTIGEAVTVSKNGKFILYDTDKSKWVRVLIIAANLPVADKSDAITITALNGAQYARAHARRHLNLYRDPAHAVKFNVSINDVEDAGNFIVPTDHKNITTDEAFVKGKDQWTKEPIMLTSVRPDFGKNIVKIEAVMTKLYKRYGFIAPAGTPDYASQTEIERKYATIGRASDNKVYDGTGYVEGFVIW